MENKKIIISKKDYELLETHLKKSDLSEFNKQKLATELKNAIVVSNNDPSLNEVVCLHSKTEIKNTETEKVFNFQLVLPQEANMQKGKLSVFAPIGIALLGYGVGATVEWQMPDGMKTFEILNVSR